MLFLSYNVRTRTKFPGAFDRPHPLQIKLTSFELCGRSFGSGGHGVFGFV